MSTTLARAPEVEPVQVAVPPRELDGGLISRLGRGPLPEVELVGPAVAPAGARSRRRSPLGRPFGRDGHGPPSPPRPAGRGPLALRPPRPLPSPRGLTPATPAPTPRRASPLPPASPAPVLPELAPWLSARPTPALAAVPVAAGTAPALPARPARAGAGAPRRRRFLPVGLVVGAVAASAALAAAAGVLPSPLSGGGGSAGGGTPPLATPLAPTADALAEIPPRYLSLYRSLGARMDIDWRFLAAIGGQESDHGRNPAADRVNRAGCVGPMQIGVGGDCGDFLSAWGTDGDGDGRVDPLDPADAIATAARGLREGKGAPPPGGAWTAYYRAACGYYGACADARADYATEVMARAERYGLPARR